MVASSSVGSLAVAQPPHTDDGIGLGVVTRFRFARAGLPRVVLEPVELTQQVLEAVRDPLADNIVVDSLQDVTESALVLTAEAASDLKRWRTGMHGHL
jgi:hypothetical protein